MREKRIKHFTEYIYVHLLIWIIIFTLPIMLADRERGFNWRYYQRFTTNLLYFLVIFYVNYLYLVPKFLFNQRRKEFILINLFLIIFFAILMQLLHNYTHLFTSNSFYKHRRYVNRTTFWAFPFIIRNIISLTLVLGLCVSIKLSSRWLETENERNKLAKANSEMELQNLKNQINPHFLLNTLNNIYALIEFNTAKAQQAVHDLSKLLRHILYDNNQDFIQLTKEIDFIKKYIDLMKIRLSDNVKVNVIFDFEKDRCTQIAPLIFISLVENAFKHGINSENDSFIDIKLEENVQKEIKFQVSNSYYPKSDKDKSGNGIGLKQLRKQLEMIYKSDYQLSNKIENNIYTTVLIIKTKK